MRSQYHQSLWVNCANKTYINSDGENIFKPSYTMKNIKNNQGLNIISQPHQKYTHKHKMYL